MNPGIYRQPVLRLIYVTAQNMIVLVGLYWLVSLWLVIFHETLADPRAQDARGGGRQ